MSKTTTPSTRPAAKTPGTSQSPRTVRRAGMLEMVTVELDGLAERLEGLVQVAAAVEAIVEPYRLSDGPEAAAIPHRELWAVAAMAASLAGQLEEVGHAIQANKAKLCALEDRGPKLAAAS